MDELGSYLSVHKVSAVKSQASWIEMMTRFIDVQVQEGVDDCAIAFATALCDNVDPHSLSLDQKKALTLSQVLLRGRKMSNLFLFY